MPIRCKLAFLPTEQETPINTIRRENKKSSEAIMCCKRGAIEIKTYPNSSTDVLTTCFGGHMVSNGEEARSTRDGLLLVMESRLSVKFAAISQASIKILGTFLSYPYIFNS